MQAHLVLETGQVFTGRSLGAPAAAGGEVVFHTGMTGYQEILTDPSYAGQMVVFTAPHLGNYGVHLDDSESPLIRPAAVVVRDFCRRDFHRRSESGLDHVLRRARVPALADVDTRALTVAIREGGACRGYLGEGDPAELLALARDLPSIGEIDWVARVSTPKVEIFPEQPDAADPYEVAVLDCGAKKSILRRLVAVGCRVRLFPHDTPAADLLAAPTEGVLLSNGPGDPAARPDLAATAAAALDAGAPLMGICLGHQLLARALGAETAKLPFGHHGANHPVQNLQTGRVEITSQNHNYAVPEASLDPSLARVTHRSLNDGSVEGLQVAGRDAFGVQYHPEAAPGPSDSLYLFEQFTGMMRRRRDRRDWRRRAAQG